MRAGRLVDMLLTLQRRGRLTAAELAAALEVSPRTILRDVDALSSAGVPIYTVQRVGGGIELVDRFRTRLTAFTADEAAALLLAGQPTVADQLGLGAAAGAARRKLLDALPDALRDTAEGTDRWFLHDPLGRGESRLPYGELRRLARCGVFQGTQAGTRNSTRPSSPISLNGTIGRSSTRRSSSPRC